MNKLQPIIEIAKKLNLTEDDIELYGKYKAKISAKIKNKKGKLILISAINPTKYGEGKTTMAIGLADGLNLIGKKAVLALREPSLGPVFGLKGGATGGGKANIGPSDEINIHFTGDFHAISLANNLLCALIDNHIFHGNSLNIDENKILFHRCIDMNDRALREITISQEKLKHNIPRKESFTITAASEIMAILCLAKDLKDLKQRLADIMVAFSIENKPIYAKDLKAQDSMAILLKDAIRPNLVQTLEGTPAIVHGGPFANIAHGCNSVIATKTALELGDYVITEAGFGGDLGGEKFIDLKCRLNGLNPSLVVIVVTIKALKAHDLNGNIEGGLANLEKHIQNFRNVFNKEVVVAINKFSDDSEQELEKVKSFCDNIGCHSTIASPFLEGGKGCQELAKIVSTLCDKKNTALKYSYPLDECIEDKIKAVATKIYGAKNVVYSDLAKQKIKAFEKLAKNMPIVIAKTQYSLSDDEHKLGAPKDFDFHVQDVQLKNGAKFVVVIAGKISLMPGLPTHPNSEILQIDSKGNIKNLK